VPQIREVQIWSSAPGIM